MYRLAVLIFFVLLFAIGLCQADSTVVELFDVWYKQNNQANFVGTANGEVELDRKLDFCERRGIAADSIDIFYTQFLYFPATDSFAVIFRNYHDMSFSYDTLDVDYWDPDWWAAWMGASQDRYTPIISE
jgi:hypothetical protein